MRCLWIMIMLLGIGISRVDASAPRDASILYDAEKKMLHIFAKHPTDRPEKHYINRVKIYKNGVLAETKNYFWQKSPAGIDQDIPFVVDTGDKISVEITCVDGGKALVGAPMPEAGAEDSEQK